MNSQDVRMLQASGQLDFPLKALGAERRGQLRMEDLQRNRPVMAQVMGEIHRRHTTAPEFALDTVAVDKGRSQLIVQVYYQPRALVGNV
jgi:hypothetical protein